MIGSLKLTNYRAFSEFAVSGLKQVNLFVGANNSGKSSILEAVELASAGGDPLAFREIAMRRGEVSFPERSYATAGSSGNPEISHFFHGHDFGEGSQFSIATDDGLGEINVRIIDFEQSELKEVSPYDESAGRRALLVVQVFGDDFRQEFPAYASGEIRPRRRVTRTASRDVLDSAPAQFITPDSLEPRSMSDMWERVVLEGRESEVIRAMQLIEPRLDNIFFVHSNTPDRFGARGGVLLGFEGERRRHPLGSHGEGMRRLLALSLSLIRTEGGMLLVDEIDTGLHYSVMPDMWRVVVSTARDSNIQVFATTHSFDCVRGLAWLCRHNPELGALVSLQKVDRGLSHSVGLSGEEIITAVQQEIEVR